MTGRIGGVVRATALVALVALPAACSRESAALSGPSAVPSSAHRTVAVPPETDHPFVSAVASPTARGPARAPSVTTTLPPTGSTAGRPSTASPPAARTPAPTSGSTASAPPPRTSGPRPGGPVPSSPPPNSAPPPASASSAAPAPSSTARPATPPPSSTARPATPPPSWTPSSAPPPPAGARSTAPPASSSPLPAAAADLPEFHAAIHPIDAALADRMSSYRSGCPVPLSDLRYLTMTYLGFDGRPHTGELVVSARVADDVVTAFRELYRHRFPIRQMRLVDDFGGSDDASMAADNTSAFNCRPVTGGGGWSEHSYGEAIDINPLENPYLSGDTVLPPGGAAYLDRPDAPGVIHPGDVVVGAFAGIGWTWGGTWSSPVDLQHFSRSGR